MKFKHYINIGKESTRVRHFSTRFPLKRGIYKIDYGDVEWLNGKEYTVNLNFSSNKGDFSSFTITPTGLNYGAVTVSTGADEWTNQNYRFIEITTEQWIDEDVFMNMIVGNIAFEYVVPSKMMQIDYKLPIGKFEQIDCSPANVSIMTNSYDSTGKRGKMVAASDFLLTTSKLSIGAITYDGTNWRYGSTIISGQSAADENAINCVKIEGLTTMTMLGYYYYILQNRVEFFDGDAGSGWITDSDMQPTAGKDTTWTGIYSTDDKSTKAQEIYSKIKIKPTAEEILTELGSTATLAVMSALDIPNYNYLNNFVKAYDVGDVYSASGAARLIISFNPAAVCLLCLQSDGTYKAVAFNEETSTWDIGSSSAVLIMFVDTAKY